MTPDTAARIEADRAFARKFVKPEELLDKELATPLAEAIEGSAPPKDITAAWTQALNDGGLGRICDPKAPYTDIIESFLSGKERSKETQEAIAILPAESGRQITKLRIKKFRTHPSISDFDFAKVNLIRGANGAGKTSLLEAIELSICGGIRRQDGARPPDARLDITFAGDNQPQSCPYTNSALYRARDLAWYGQYNRIGNRLCYNFSRFNFFDSDAAFRLSSATSGQEIKEAIGALFLGEQANTLENRMIACEERFRAEERQLSKKLSGLRKQGNKWRVEIDDLKNIVDTRDTLAKELRAKASEIKWKTLPARLNPKQLVTLKESVDNLISEVDEILRQIHWLPAVSLRLLNEESRKMAKCLQEISALQKSLQALTEERLKAREDLAGIESELKVLTRLLVYHEVPEASSLPGTLAAVQKSKARLEQIAKAMNLMKKVDIEPFRDVNATLSNFRKEHESGIVKQQRLISQQRATLEELNRNIGQTRALVEQIKGLGHRFCELNPDSKDCPLCAAHYELEGLASRLEAIEVESSFDSTLRELTAELERETAKLSGQQTLSTNLQRIGEAASLTLHSKHLDSTLRSITARLSALGTERTQEQSKLEELTAKQSCLSLQGLSEAELEKLLSEANTIFGSRTVSSSAVRKGATNRNKRATLIKRSLEDFAKLDTKTRRQLRALHKLCLGVDDSTEPAIEMERRLASIQEALAMAAKAVQKVSIRVTDDFAHVKSQLAMFSASLGRTQRALRELEEKDVLEKRLGSSIKENEKDIVNLDSRHERAKRALELIHGLLRTESKAKYLSDIVRDHRERLSTLFCRIHAPNEFEDVELNGELFLKRTVGINANVSEISTGQRSALALSIFLTMNSSVSKRAPWLIFDEPVAHVDDLNILSFFDTLRDLVLLGNQQIFFATANARIADLFVRKFDFLGSALLKEFRLDRSN